MEKVANRDTKGLITRVITLSRNSRVKQFCQGGRMFEADKQTKGLSARLIHKNTFLRQGTGKNYRRGGRS